MLNLIKSTLKFIGLSCVMGLLLTACGQKQAGVSGAKAFESADAAIKSSWNKAYTAAGTNDYVVAIFTLREMMKAGNLSKPQIDVAERMLEQTSQRMYQAAEKGDASAQQAIDALKAMGRR